MPPKKTKATKARPKVFREPKKMFRVGTDKDADFHPGEIEALTLKVAQWYGDPKSGRVYADPLAAAKEHIRQCLVAETDAGKVWNRVPKTMESRVRIKCNYNMSEDRGYPNARVRAPIAERALDPAARKAAKGTLDVDILAASFDREAYETTMVRDIFHEYPELDNAVHRPNVERLALLYAEQELLKIDLKIGGNVKKRLEILEALGKLEKSAETTMKLLDIHPDQLRKKIDKRREGTLGELVALLDGDEDFAERERTWALQAALQFWWMANHLNGRGDGPQLEEWEIYHLTRSRPVHYKCKCGFESTLVEGFTPTELRDYLIRRGVLVTEPVFPGITPKEALVGIDGTWDEEGEAADERLPQPDE